MSYYKKKQFLIASSAARMLINYIPVKQVCVENRGSYSYEISNRKENGEKLFTFAGFPSNLCRRDIIHK